MDVAGYGYTVYKPIACQHHTHAFKKVIVKIHLRILYHSYIQLIGRFTGSFKLAILDRGT